MSLRHLLTVTSGDERSKAVVHRDDRAGTYHVTHYPVGAPPRDLGAYATRAEALSASYEAAGCSLAGEDAA